MVVWGAAQGSEGLVSTDETARLKSGVEAHGQFQMCLNPQMRSSRLPSGGYVPLAGCIGSVLPPFAASQWRKVME